MTFDWVKMRTDLYRDPKVIWIADCLFDPEGKLARHVELCMDRDMCVTRNVTRNATVGALVTLWGTIRHRGKREGDDLTLSAAQLFTVDEIADLPGLGAAMAQVGWVIEDGNNLTFPNFFGEFNYDPTEEKRTGNAERQKRYRDKKRDVTRDVTVTLRSNIEKRREEKRREEDLDPPLPPVGDVEGAPPEPLAPPTPPAEPKPEPRITGKKAKKEPPYRAYSDADFAFPPKWGREATEALGRWIAYKSLAGHPSLLTSYQAQVKHFASNPAFFVQLVDRAIREGWQGLNEHARLPTKGATPTPSGFSAAHQHNLELIRRAEEAENDQG